jgi:hypothetical protein
MQKMTMLTIESAKQMSTEELHTLVWDWYKDVNGIRPRHIGSNDREAMLSFIEYELRPEVQARREQEWAEEAKLLDEMEARYEAELAASEKQRQEERELELAYDDQFDHLVK